MHISRTVIFLSACLILSGQGVQAAPDGAELYGRYCSSCHGLDGKGGVGVPLSLPSFLDTVPDEYLKKTIRNGRTGRIMPAFQGLSDAQISAVVKYIRGWTDKPAIKEDMTPIDGDVKKGEKLFAERCSQCHGEEGRGGRGTGVTLSRKRDLPIIAPALNNSGFLASASDVMIRDTIANGREGTPMISMLSAGLTKSDIDDLVAYIRSFENSAAVLEKALNGQADEPPVIMLESPYDMEETIEKLKQAITDQNFTLIRTDYLDSGLVEEGKENKKQVMLHFCNFGFLFDALSIDPRVGMFLPCRVTVVEKDGKVTLSTINPRRLSTLFNNDELSEDCDKMYEVYSGLLEDATL